MKILFQGDSVTDAGRTGVSGENLGRGYPLFVAGKLRSQYPDKGFDVVNRGISGNRVVDLYQRWKVDCLNHRPDVISILIGINDTWHERGNHNGVEVDRYEMVYRELVKWTLKVLPDVRLVLCEPFMLTADQAADERTPGVNWAPAADWAPEMAERRAIVKAIAEESGALFVPFQGILENALGRAGAEYWLGDGVHPTVAGHALLADAWIAAAASTPGI